MYSGLGYPKYIGEKTWFIKFKFIISKDKDQGDCNLVESEVRLPILPGLWSSCGELLRFRLISCWPSPYHRCAPTVVLPLFRKWLHGHAAEKRPRKDSFSQESPGVPSSICLTLPGSTASICKALVLSVSLHKAHPDASNHQNISQVKSPGIFCSLFFYSICYHLLKLLCSHSFAHSFNKYLVRASCMPGTCRAMCVHSSY